MTNCKICNKRIWFWQKDKYRLAEMDNGDRLGQHIHKKCGDKLEE